MKKISHKPGDIVKIAGTEFAVLDVQENAALNGEDKLMVILKEPVCCAMFGEDGNNNYARSVLREKTCEWFGQFAEGINRVYIYSREIDLTTMDGRENYGVLHPLVAPLTFDEWRRYSRYIPDCEEGSWLATGDGAPGRHGAECALYVSSDGDWNSCFCRDSWAVRPTLIVSSHLVEDEERDLSRYTTEELLKEIKKRNVNCI